MKKIAVLFLAALMALSCACFSEPSPEKVEKRVAAYAEKVKPQIAEIAETMKDTLAVDVYAEGASLIMEYRYLSDLGVDEDALRRTLANSDESFLESYNELKKYAGSDTVSVIMRYLASDGTKILDYVIDKDFVPGEGPSIKKEYASVEEFISSEEFLSSFGSDPSTGTEVSACMEEGKLVVSARLLDDYDAEYLEAIADSWLSNISSGAGDDAAKTLIASMKLLVTDFDGCEIVYRLTDKEGNKLEEYAANTGN